MNAEENSKNMKYSLWAHTYVARFLIGGPVYLGTVATRKGRLGFCKKVRNSGVTILNLVWSAPTLKIQPGPVFLFSQEYFVGLFTYTAIIAVLLLLYWWPIGTNHAE